MGRETRGVSLFGGAHLSIAWFWSLFPCLPVPNPSVLLPVFSPEAVVTGDRGQSEEYLNTLFIAPLSVSSMSQTLVLLANAKIKHLPNS